MQEHIKMKKISLHMHNYLLELINKSKNEYVREKPTLCMSCDRTGCRLHIDPNATDHPKPCEWLQEKAKLPKGAEYAAMITKTGDVRIQVISCPKFTDKIGW